MNKDNALTLLTNQWSKISPHYGTVTQWMKENKIKSHSLEAITRVLLRGNTPCFDLAVKLGDKLGLSRNQLKFIADCYGESLYASLLDEQDVPTPELDLARRIMTLSPKERRLIYGMVEIMEEK